MRADVWQIQAAASVPQALSNVFPLLPFAPLYSSLHEEGHMIMLCLYYG